MVIRSMERYSLLVLTKGEFKDELYEFNARSYDYKEEKDPIYKRLEISYEDARHLDRGEFDLMENDIKALKNFDKALDYVTIHRNGAEKNSFTAIMIM